ncbi:hypothetical protein [Corynebacterium pyruviciproducens]|uniref:hypothetical protein n=1 Tax=Corynebacterium pyruviciproducens TaxID=598660 RepID=UPI0023F475D1|nr:hypothetical protein [Corynebacterium pyruviciproducens]MDK6565064.1 hypothetical protein [Corynebacterium pyruviciproducens]MDK7213908.1 hypothetical protein [Corynebacterium pyruviciproducens]
MAQKPPPVWEQRDAETAEAYSTPPKMPVTGGSGNVRERAVLARRAGLPRPITEHPLAPARETNHPVAHGGRRAAADGEKSRKPRTEE